MVKKTIATESGKRKTDADTDTDALDSLSIAHLSRHGWHFQVDCYTYLWHILQDIIVAWCGVQEGYAGPVLCVYDFRFSEWRWRLWVFSLGRQRGPKDSGVRERGIGNKFWVKVSATLALVLGSSFLCLLFPFCLL